MNRLKKLTYVRTQHDRRLLGGRQGHHLEVPSVRGHGVGDVTDDLTRETLLAIWVDNGKGNGILSMRDNREVSLERLDSSNVPVYAERT
jgi:hypothetical protein